MFHAEKELTAKPPLTDDDDLSWTKNYTDTLELLRLLHNALVRTIETWERFERGQIQYFEVENQEILRNTWDGFLADIENDFDELCSFRTTLQQKIATFNDMRNGVRLG